MPPAYDAENPGSEQSETELRVTMIESSNQVPKTTLLKRFPAPANMGVHPR